ncbi:MAG: UDP-N-acetylmuramoyl-L-alanine--D-glutamate ligase, partial [Catenibacillus sp.]
MDLKNKTVLVAGTGISGIGACRLLDQVGANIILYDSNKALTREKILERLPERIAPVTIVIGDLPQTVIEGLDLAVLSPGVPVDTPFVCRIRAAGVPVWGEVELAYNYSRGTLAGITGTNGKTTTTALTGEIMKAWS